MAPARNAVAGAWPRRRGMHLLMLAILALACSHARGADDLAGSREDQFKAAYLLNFVKFVEWPASVPTDLLTICFVGGDGVHAAFATGIESKRAGARRLAVRRLAQQSNAEGCNAIYVDGTSAQSAPHLSAANAPPILTVSDAAAFARQGGMIELFTDDNRLRFSINIDNAQRAGLRISSSLLHLAAAVERDTP